MDIWENKNLKPMLIGADSGPFDDPDYLFELKLDGERCLAYLSKDGTELRNKRNMRLLPKFPELSQLHRQVKKNCILDGELAVIKDGKPNFFEVQRRSLLSNQFKIRLAASSSPACFTAFDILYLDGKPVMDSPLAERKKLLGKTVRENQYLAVSRFIEEKGSAFYRLAEQNNLEGIVAKRKNSKYWPATRTKDWVKIKFLQDDDFVVCGYIRKSDIISSIVLGQYRGSELVYIGHVTLGVSGDDFRIIQNHKTINSPPMSVPKGHGNENAVWLSPDLVCVVRYMMKTDSGSLRQPVFKGLRYDKSPLECKATGNFLIK